MFLFSKLIALSSLTLGTIGLSIYLIPLALRGTNPKINSLFKEFKSLYKSNDLSEFDESERKILDKLNDLFKAFSGAVEYSNYQKSSMNEKMQEFLNSISKSENLLQDLYRKNLEVIDKLSKVFDQLSNLLLEDMLLKIQIGAAYYSKQLAENLEKAFEPFQKSINEFICFLDLKELKEDETSCQENSSKIIQQTQQEGGALV